MIAIKVIFSIAVIVIISICVKGATYPYDCGDLMGY